MTWWLRGYTGLVLVISLLSLASSAALPNRRHLLQYPRQPAHSHDGTGIKPPKADVPSDPYTSLLEKTIEKHQATKGNYWDVFLNEDVQLVKADEEPDGAVAQKVSVDASKDGRQEVDMDIMTARSPYLKSLEDEDEEAEKKALMAAWDIFEQNTIEKSTEEPKIEKGNAEAVTEKPQITTPAAHPSYNQAQEMAKPWQSPEEDERKTSESNKLHLTTLVENQMNSYFPVTGEDSSDQSQSTQFAVLGQVQQSLAKALRQDIESLSSLLGGKEEEVLDNVKALYEDYSILKSNDPMAESQAPVSVKYKDVKVPGVKLPVQAKKKPVDLKEFFAKYDLEVDADMMQEKILSILQEEPENNEMGLPAEEDIVPKMKKDKADNTIHFHKAQVAPPSKFTPDKKKTCTKSHDLSAIFKNLDLEVDADKMDETLKNYHEKLQENTKKQNMPIEKPKMTTGKAKIDLKNFMTSFDLETDAEEVTSRFSDLVDSKIIHPTADTYKPYFTEEEKQAYDSESIEDFYTRFYTLKGTIIHAVPLMTTV